MKIERFMEMMEETIAKIDEPMAEQYMTTLLTAMMPPAAGPGGGMGLGIPAPDPRLIALGREQGLIRDCVLAVAKGSGLSLEHVDGPQNLFDKGVELARIIVSSFDQMEKAATKQGIPVDSMGITKSGLEW